MLKPQQFHDQDGTGHVIGSNEQSQLIFGLLDRLYYLHKLYSAACPLCSREVSNMPWPVLLCICVIYVRFSCHIMSGVRSSN